MSKRSQRQNLKRQEKLKRKQQRLLKVKSRQQQKDLLHADQINITELEAIIDRAGQGPLNEQERQLLLSVSHTLRFVTEQLENKSISINRLRKLLFGASTESLKNLDQTSSDKGDPDSSTNPQDTPDPTTPDPSKKKPKGHGRNGADAYTGAKKVNIAHETLTPGDPCPACLKGTVYETTDPGRLVRVTGQTPLQATVYELQKLRCGLCGTIFTAAAPKDMGSEKYDAQAVSMIALLKYGTGIPFHRLQRLQETLSKHEHVFGSVYRAFIVAAAQGRILHNDDTTMQILNRSDLKQPDDAERKGIFTSGIVSVGDNHQIALFFTGHRHAGENLAHILKHRADELSIPIQMSDGLSRNVPGEFETLLANCLAHGRRKFVDVYEAFASECHTVLNVLAQVYRHETTARDTHLSDAERLIYHQQHSGPLMAELKHWMTQQLDDHQVEPNSGLGEAIRYILKHWEALTLFLRQPGVPLDNNLCERALKKAILHRKNAYFYKTAHGARVGDMFMSLIHTCELNSINPFDYLTILLKHADSVSSNPNAWMPWNYQDTLSQLENAGDLSPPLLA